MNFPKHPLRINVGFLLNASVGSFRDIHFDFPQLNLDGDFPVTEFKGVVRITRTPQGILTQSDFTCQAPAECMRCLREVNASLHAQFDELFAFDSRSVTESGLILREDANIDLEPLAREYLELELPISVVCREDCKGLCPVCGQDLNEADCGHSQPSEEG